MDSTNWPDDGSGGRQGRAARQTGETDIAAAVNLDGTGKSGIATGIGFLDHMLNQLARHGRFDIEMTAKGDLHVDFHHTTEDAGIVLGKAFAQAIGDAKGIERFADACAAMDDCLTRVAIDVSGRPFLVWKVEFTQDKIGEIDTELFQEFFHAFAQSSGITLHIENFYGVNNHHRAESCFKAFAVALRRALAVDARFADQVPSTKGVLSLAGAGDDSE